MQSKPHTSSELVREGEKAFREGHIQRAVDIFHKVLGTTPECVDALNNPWSLQAGELNRAFSFFSRGYDLDKKQM